MREENNSTTQTIKIELPADKSAARQGDALEYDVRKRYAALVFHNQEYRYAHNSYEAEQQEMRCIENGDLSGLEHCWSEMARQLNRGDSFFGTLASDPKRNIKDLCIAVITLASRAAIRGGLRPEESFCLCDCYVQKLEECGDSALFGQLALRAERHFTELVHEQKTASDPRSEGPVSRYANRCMDYIFAHLHEKLTVQQIADALHLHPNYLSALFKRQTGQTILQYILQEKIKLAQNMLIYSDYSYSEIATYLGFSSQSQMGVHFKKYTALSPHAYRRRYRVAGMGFSGLSDPNSP
ncbi:MAG: helix-turn-helix domain-containing protein [Eubacteriales bacterium]|nr:helix-turn-helix domain-containing protein [Eubacteriales bacterium]